MSQQPRNQMRPGERSDNLGFTNRLPGGTVRPGSRGSARTSELGMGAGFSGQSTQGDALQQSMAAEQKQANMGMGAYGGNGGGASSMRGAPGGRGRGRATNPRGGFGGPGFGRGNPAGGPGGLPSGAGYAVGGYPPPQPPSGGAFRAPQQPYDDGGEYDEPSVLDVYPQYPPPSSTQGSVKRPPQVQFEGVSASSSPAPSSTSFAAARSQSDDGAFSAKIRSELVATLQRLTRVETALAAAVSTGKSESDNDLKQFFGIVSGGAAGAVLLFPDLPTAQTGPPDAAQACAKASRSKWLKLSYPRVRRDFTGDLSVDGTSKTAWWYNVHAVDPITGDYKVLWVCDRADDGSPAFERFAMYPQ